jgi:transcriptional regulator with XRE-family HTH domain
MMLAKMGEPLRDPLTRAVATNVKRFRKAAKLSQGALADAAGVNKNTINRFETGKQTIELSTLYELSQALGVDVEDLIRMPVGEMPVAEIVAEYEKSPWKLIDKPEPWELDEISKPGVVRWLGAKADAEAVHLALLALRRRRS